MKKLVVALAMVFGLGSSVVFAQDVKSVDQTVATQQAPQDEFVKIEIAELPQAVTDAVAKAHEGATVKEAFVCAKETGKVFKLVLADSNGGEVVALFNENGEAVEAEAAPAEPVKEEPVKA